MFYKLPLDMRMKLICLFTFILDGNLVAKQFPSYFVVRQFNNGHRVPQGCSSSTYLLSTLILIVYVHNQAL